MRGEDTSSVVRVFHSLVIELTLVLRLIEYFEEHEGVELRAYAEVYDDFKSKSPTPQGAFLPAPAGVKLQEIQLA
jgi:hypothetical protein